MDPVECARRLSALVATLIPGDEAWPAADVIGVQAVVASRLVDSMGEHALDGLFAALPSLLDAGESERLATVEKFEAADPVRFRWVRDATFLAYYESPLVVRAMNARGMDYRRRPHGSGYDLPPFDPATDTPTHGRGHWIRVP